MSKWLPFSRSSVSSFLFSQIKSKENVKMTYFIVPTTDGNIKGRQTKTKSNFSYYAFYKIPFAKPPVGDLRFNIIISYLSYRVI